MRRWIELSISFLCLAFPQVGEAAVWAGPAKADITPPLPAAFDLLQVATEVAHPLYARVLYLADKDDEVVLVATDYEGILRTAYDQLRNAISTAVNVPGSSIIINANHSHNAPWINLDLEDLLAPHGLRQVDRAYFSNVVTRIAEAALHAKRAKRAVTISAGIARLPELAWNRRTGYVSPEAVELLNRVRHFPIGTTDPDIGLMRLDDERGVPVAVLSVYASHYVSAGSGKISSSFSGPAMERIERELGSDCVSLFLQGCAGNIAPPRSLANGTKQAVDEAGDLFASRALPVLRNGMTRVGDESFRFKSRRVKLPLAPLREHGSMEFVRSMFSKPAVNAGRKYSALNLRQLDEKFYKALRLYKAEVCKPNSSGLYSYVLNLTAYGDRLTLARNLKAWSKYDLQVMQAGPLCLVFLPGESFVELGLHIREESGAPFTFVAAYNDCTPVYVPDETAFEEGGYEVGLWCYSTPQTGTRLVKEALRLIAK